MNKEQTNNEQRSTNNLSPYQRFIETLMNVFIILVLAGICLKVLFF